MRNNTALRLLIGFVALVFSFISLLLFLTNLLAGFDAPVYSNVSIGVQFALIASIGYSIIGWYFLIRIPKEAVAVGYFLLGVLVLAGLFLKYFFS